MPRGSGKTLLLPRIVLLFFMFPYTQIVPFTSYTQPYAIFFGTALIIARPSSINSLPKLDRLLLTSLAAMGIIMVLLELPFGLDRRELAMLLSYLTPLVSTTAAYWIFRHHPKMSRRMLVSGLLIWVAVSFIQTFFSSSFLVALVTANTDLATNIFASGRGALGLAPEPTHNAFQLLLLGAIVASIGGPIWAVALAAGSALLLAKSASAALAIGIGFLLWAARHPIRRFWVFVPFVVLPSVVAVMSSILPDDTRIGAIFHTLSNVGPSLLLLDYSINARIAGATMPILYSIENFLIPEGISIQNWLDIRDNILSQHAGIIDLSLSGPASGIGLFILQGGLFALPFITYLFYRLIVQDTATIPSLAAAIILAIFLGQFYFSTPTFGLFLATIIGRHWPIQTRPENLETIMTA